MMEEYSPGDIMRITMCKAHNRGITQLVIFRRLINPSESAWGSGFTATDDTGITYKYKDKCISQHELVCDTNHQSYADWYQALLPKPPLDDSDDDSDDRSLMDTMRTEDPVFVFPGVSSMQRVQLLNRRALCIEHAAKRIRRMSVIANRTVNRELGVVDRKSL